MPDKNAARNEQAEKISEKVQDNLKLIEEAFFDSAPFRWLNDGNVSTVAPQHAHQILEQVRADLNANKIEDAADQLRREVDFCNAIPKMAGSPYDETGQAGLKVLNEHQSAAQIEQAMIDAWNKAWEEDPAPFYKHAPAKKLD